LEDLVPAQGSGRRTAQRQSAAEAARADEAARKAEQAEEVTVAAAEEAEEAEGIAVAAAAAAVDAAREAEAGAIAAGRPQQVLLMPSQELRNLVRTMIEGMRGGTGNGGGGPSNGDGGPSNGGASRVGENLTFEQQQLTLNYDAFCTLVARRGAASVVLYRIDFDKESIVIDQQVADGDTVVVYGRPADHLDQPMVELGRARYHAGGILIRALGSHPHVDRVEVLDRHGRPVRLGGPAVPLGPGSRTRSY
jgi:hypothetical protein